MNNDLSELGVYSESLEFITCIMYLNKNQFKYSSSLHIQDQLFLIKKSNIITEVSIGEGCIKLQFVNLVYENMFTYKEWPLIW